MATHSSIFAWKIPWTEEPGAPRSMEPQRVGHDWATKHIHIYMHLSIYIHIHKRCYYYSLLYLQWLEQYLIYSRSSLNYPLDGWMDEWRCGQMDERVHGWVVSPFREEVRRKPAVRHSEGKTKEGARACEITKFLYFLQHYKLSSKIVKTFLLI